MVEDVVCSSPPNIFRIVFSFVLVDQVIYYTLQFLEYMIAVQALRISEILLTVWFCITLFWERRFQGRVQIQRPKKTQKVEDI